MKAQVRIQRGAAAAKDGGGAKQTSLAKMVALESLSLWEAGQTISTWAGRKVSES